MENLSFLNIHGHPCRRPRALLSDFKVILASMTADRLNRVLRHGRAPSVGRTGDFTPGVQYVTGPVAASPPSAALQSAPPSRVSCSCHSPFIQNPIRDGDFVSRLTALSFASARREVVFVRHRLPEIPETVPEVFRHQRLEVRAPVSAFVFRHLFLLSLTHLLSN